MFQLPDGTPWVAVLVLAVFGLLVFGIRTVVRAVWPQKSEHRKELLQEWQRQRARRRRENNMRRWQRRDQ